MINMGRHIFSRSNDGGGIQATGLCCLPSLFRTNLHKSVHRKRNSSKYMATQNDAVGPDVQASENVMAVPSDKRLVFRNFLFCTDL